MRLKSGNAVDSFWPQAIWPSARLSIFAILKVALSSIGPRKVAKAVYPNGCSRCYGCQTKRYIRTDDWAFDLPGMTVCPECRTRPIARSDCDEGGYDGFFADVGWNPAASRLPSPR